MAFTVTEDVLYPEPEDLEFPDPTPPPQPASTAPDRATKRFRTTGEMDVF